MPRPLLARLVPAAIVAAVAGALFRQTSGWGLMGHDFYPILVASRVGTLADLAGTFSERLMDGRYPGAFYRPLLNLTFALDWAVWGLWPIGWQLTSVLLFALCAAAVWALLRRLLGPAAWIGPLAGLGVFLLSPLQLEVLPVPPRRPEYLCCGFMAVALWLALAPPRLAARKIALLPALATLLAIASKETGFLVPPLVALAVALYSDATRTRDRLVHAARATLPHLVVAALMLALRLVVLGGPGGHAARSAPEIAGAFPAALRALLRDLVWPQPAMREAPLAIWLLAGLGAAAVATLLLRARAGAPEAPLGRAGKAALVGLAWIVLVALAYAAAGLIGPWYLLLPLAGWALLTGGLADALSRLVEHDDGRVRAPALLAAALLAVLVVWQASYSPLVRRYDEWERATAASTAFLAETRTRLEAARPGRVVEAPPLPGWVAPRTDGPSVRGAAVLADYAVQAWADLVLPQRRVRVRAASDAGRPPAESEVVLEVGPRAAPAGPRVLSATRRIDRPGFALEYPAEWTIDEDDEGYDPDRKFAIGPEFADAAVSFWFYPEPFDPAVCIGETLEQLGSDYTLEGVTHLARWGRHPGAGRRGRFAVEGQVYEFAAFCATRQPRPFEVLEIVEQAQVEALRPGFERIRETLELKPAASP